MTLDFFLVVVFATNEASTSVAFAAVSTGRFWWQRWLGRATLLDLGHISLCLHHQRHLLWLDYDLRSFFVLEFCTDFVVTCGYLVLVVTCAYLWLLVTPCRMHLPPAPPQQYLAFTYVYLCSLADKEENDVLSDLIY